MNKNYRELIPISDIHFKGNEVKYVLDAVESNWVSSIGPYIDRFEKEFAETMSSQYAVSVNNGTSAILLALKALNIGPGDEVIAPSFTFAATVNAILYAGATPVLVDSMDTHWNLDLAEVEQAITPATKAIIPVHLYGHPCDMQNILRIAEAFDLFIIEDAAEAHSANILEKKVGTLGTIGCFSFYGNKIMTTGEGGMCITQDKNLNERLRILRDHGMNKNRRYWHDEIGFNFRMTNLNAALGVAQLEQLEEFLERRKYLSSLYDQGFAGEDERVFTIPNRFGEPVHWLYCLFLKKEAPISRGELLSKLKVHNIDARPTFFPIHTMPPYRKLERSSDMSNAEKYGKNGINLPLHPTLSDENISYIVETMINVLN
jgi:perosamine synthetase